MKYINILKKTQDGSIELSDSVLERKTEAKKRAFNNALGKLKDQRDKLQDEIEDMLISVNVDPDVLNKADIELAMVEKKIELAEKRIKDLF